MMEKLKNMIISEKIKEASKKIFTKKKVGVAAAVLAGFILLSAGYSTMFEVNGTIVKIGSNSLVVRNFFGTKTVDIGNYPIDSSRIAVGEKIEIDKNISGDIISIKVDGNKGGRGDMKGIGQPGFNQNGQSALGQNNAGGMQNGQIQNSPSQNSTTQNSQMPNAPAQKNVNGSTNTLELPNTQSN